MSSPLEGSTLAGSTASRLAASQLPERSPSKGSAPALKGKATRTYTGAALARRKAWGKEWGQVGKQWKTEHTTRGN